MSIVVIETIFDKPYTDEAHGEHADKLGPCLEAHGATWQRSYLSGDRLRMICHIEAPDAESVRASYRNAGVKFDKVWTATLYTTEGAQS
jgi:hypothetical protein